MKSIKNAAIVCCLLGTPSLVAARSARIPVRSRPLHSFQKVKRPRQQARLMAIAKAVEEAREKMHVPGCALVIVQGDRVLFLKGFGERDRERHLPVTPGTLFNIGSCTKSFTAMAAVRSEERGHLALSDLPRKHLPYFRLRDPEADAHVTLRHLLDHRTGLGFHAGEALWVSGRLTAEETIRAMGNAKPMARPGEKYLYNNIMYTAAGEVVGRAEHSTYEDAVHNLIFRPLGMTASNFTLPFQQKKRDFSLGYTYDAASGQTRKTLPNPAAVAACLPAGGITTNAHDMAKWLRLIIGAGVFQGKPLLSAPHFAELRKMQGDYALGWAHSAWNGQPELWHSGSQEGYWAEMHVLPDQKLGYAILTNVGFKGVQHPSLPDSAREAILSELIGKQAPSPAAARADSGKSKETVAPVAPYKPPISVPELMRKVIAAAGGETCLRRHTSMRLTYSFTMEYQGIHGEGIFSQRSPNLSSQEWTLYGLNKILGTIHLYNDGIRAGMDASPSLGLFNFGSLSGTDLENARIEAAFPDFLDWQTRFKEVRIVRTETVAGEETYVVTKVPERGDPFLDYISVHSFRLLQRDDPAWGRVTYSDYRPIDGVWRPFVWEQQLGGEAYDTTIRVKEIQFNVPIPGEEFKSYPIP